MQAEIEKYGWKNKLLQGKPNRVCKIGLVQFLQAMFSVLVERDTALEANMQTAQLFVLVAPGLAELHLSSPDVSVRYTK